MIEREYASICKKMGGFVDEGHCYLRGKDLSRVDIDCFDLEGEIIFLMDKKIKYPEIGFCKTPLSHINKIEEKKMKELFLIEEERINPQHKPVGIVTTQDKQPIVSMSTTETRPFSEKTLDEAIERTLRQRNRIRLEIGDDWFPCGFAWLEINKNNPFIEFIKQQGMKEGEHEWKYKDISIRESDDHYTLNLHFPMKDAIEVQSMRYKSSLYQEFQKQLALIGIRTELRTLID